MYQAAEFPSVSIQQTPRDNRLLALLPAADYARASPHLERVTLSVGDVIYEPGSELRSVYFPATAIVSLLYMMRDGSPSAEIAIVGNDGLVGMASFMGGQSTPTRAVVQSSGHGYRINTAALTKEFALGAALQQVMLRYTQALIAQIAQTAACNRHHSLEQQLCRCLLLCLDRLPSNELSMTQELIAKMLGVRREGITEVARRLLGAGIIRYSRGHITVLDRRQIEKRACECYAVVKKEAARLLPSPTYCAYIPSLVSPRAPNTLERYHPDKTKRPSVQTNYENHDT
jgi:CRP-like cAMP-binding protein